MIFKKVPKSNETTDSGYSPVTRIEVSESNSILLLAKTVVSAETT